MNDFSVAFHTAFTLIGSFDAELRGIVFLSLAVSLTASACAFAIGAPLGTALAVYRFPGRGALIVVVNALLGLPPVVVGLAVYLLLSRSGPLGSLGILFTPAAMNAHTLTDRATWANFKNRQGLEILSEGDPALFNPYGSILIDPAKWPGVKHQDAKIWHEWLTSKAGLDAITSYRINGEQLFFPPRSATTD